MYEVIIKMVVEKEDILKNLKLVKMEIAKGEREYNDKGEVIKLGYLPNKYNNVGNSTFRILDMNSPYYEYEKDLRRI